MVNGGIFETLQKKNYPSDLSTYLTNESSSWQKLDVGSCGYSLSAYGIVSIHPDRVFRGSTNNNEIVIEFNNDVYSFSKYGMKSLPTNINCYWAYPTKWIINGSNDRINWIIINDKTKNEDRTLDDRGVIKHFELNQTYEFKYIKIITHEQDDPSKFFGFSRFELYGSIDKIIGIQ